jgi:hypothetical protein
MPFILDFNVIHYKHSVSPENSDFRDALVNASPERASFVCKANRRDEEDNGPMMTYG